MKRLILIIAAILLLSGCNEKIKEILKINKADNATVGFFDPL